MKADDARQREDGRLMERIARGEPDAWREMVDKELSGACSLAGRLLHDAAEAEEVVQEAFAALHGTAPHWREEACVATWLYRVVRNRCLDRLRRTREETGLEGYAEQPSSWGNPDEALQAKERHCGLETALQALPERWRSAILLVYHLDRSGEEAAQILGVTPEALESLLGRAKRRLRELLWSRRGDL
ncbi:MAG: sigma-70 family RNA polymerase sigma factor [Magnetococcales bacterium]|nr:sigma-70 family RNA polymerase sigma factor [Magnetococcales bacterium]